MSFSINFLEQPIPREWLAPGEQGILAEIVIGDFKEFVNILTGFWSKEDYVRQWKEASHKILEGADDTKSALVTTAHDPANPKHGYVVSWWPMYRQGDSVFIQSGSIPYENDNKHIDLSDLYSYVYDRKEDEEDEPSEWKISVTDLRQFLDSLEKNEI